MDNDRPWCQAKRLALPRQRVGPASGHLGCRVIRRNLLNVPDKFREGTGNLPKSWRRFDGLGGKRTLAVVRAAAHAQAEPGAIDFIHPLHIFGQPGGRADAEDQHAAGQRVKSSRVPNARAARQPAPRHVDGIARTSFAAACRSPKGRSRMILMHAITTPTKAVAGSVLLSLREMLFHLAERDECSPPMLRSTLAAAMTRMVHGIGIVARGIAEWANPTSA